MYAVSAAESAAEGTPGILVNMYVPLWGCPASLLYDNGLQLCSKQVYKLLGMRKIATDVYCPKGNGGGERVNHTVAQMLAMVVNEKQDDWDVHLPHVEFACNNSISAAFSASPSPSSNTITPETAKASPPPPEILRPRCRLPTKVSLVNPKENLRKRKGKSVQGRAATWMVVTFCRSGRLPLRVYTKNIIPFNLTGRSYGGHRA